MNRLECFGTYTPRNLTCILLCWSFIGPKRKCKKETIRRQRECSQDALGGYSRHNTVCVTSCSLKEECFRRRYKGAEGLIQCSFESAQEDCPRKQEQTNEIAPRTSSRFEAIELD